MRGKFNAKKAKKELDTLFSRAIRLRDKVCQKCGSPRTGQAAHIFTRSNLSTRWDVRNGLQLCYPCHIHWAHHKPVEFTLWVQQRMGKEAFEKLRKDSLKIYDPSNLKADYEKMRALLQGA